VAGGPRIGDLLRTETTGGLLLVARRRWRCSWANSPWRAAYADLSGLRVGPRRLHLDLPLGTWASDGLLAIFFFVAGLELKREFVAGDLRGPAPGRAYGRRRGGRDGGARARVRRGDRHGRRSGPVGLGDPHGHRTSPSRSRCWR
jgi:hypothetical protein